MFALVEFARFLVFLVLLGGCGLWVVRCVLPPGVRRPFALLAAPLFGLVLLPVWTILMYRAGLPFAAAGAASLILSLGASATAVPELRRRFTMHDVRAVLFALAAIAVVAFVLIDSPAWHGGRPAVELIDGSDTFGYATDADWLRDHRNTVLPEPTTAYQIIPYQNLRLDQRLGSFVVLGLTGEYLHRPSLFAYSFAVAAALAAGIAALAGLAAGKARILAFCLAGLATGALFDYAHTGFFAKVLGYPAALALGIVVLTNRGRMRAPVLLVLLFMTLGASVLHSFATTITVLGMVTLGSAIFAAVELFRTAGRRALLRRELRFCTVPLALAAVAFASSGGFGILLGRFGWEWQRFPLGLDWPFQLAPLPLALVTQDVGYFIVPAVPLGERWGVLALAVALAAQTALAVSALVRRKRTAFVLLTVPAAFVLGIGATRPWGAYQLAGMSFATCVIGTSLLLSRTRRETRSFLPLAYALLALVVIVARLPRFAFAMDRFVVHPVVAVRYTEDEFDGVRAALGGRAATVDVSGVYAIQPLVVELGRTGADLRFTPRSWIFTGWGLANPGPAASSGVEILAASDARPGTTTLYLGPHYRVVERSAR